MDPGPYCLSARQGINTDHTQFPRQNTKTSYFHLENTRKSAWKQNCQAGSGLDTSTPKPLLWYQLFPGKCKKSSTWLTPDNISPLSSQMWLLPSESRFKPPELQTFIFIWLNARKTEYTEGIKDHQSLDTRWWERWMAMQDKDFFFNKNHSTGSHCW